MQYTLTTYNPSKRYKASASFEADFFSLLICDEEGVAHTYFHQISYQSDSIDQIKEELEVKRISQRKAVFWKDAALLVPAEGFSHENVIQLCKRAGMMSEEGKIMYNQIGDIYVVWIKEDDDLIADPLYESFELFHPQAALLDNLGAEAEGIHASVSDQRLLITIFSDGKLILSNQYEMEGKDDLVYYILSAYKLGGLDPLEDQLYLSGRISQEGTLFNRLRQFVAHFEWEGPKGLDLGDEFIYPAHMFSYYKL